MLTPPQPDIESPCIRECVIDQQSGFCRGCLRTLDEISFWVRYSPHERLRVMKQLGLRRACLHGSN